MGDDFKESIDIKDTLEQMANQLKTELDRQKEELARKTSDRDNITERFNEAEKGKEDFKAVLEQINGNPKTKNDRGLIEECKKLYQDAQTRSETFKKDLEGLTGQISSLEKDIETLNPEVEKYTKAAELVKGNSEEKSVLKQKLKSLNAQMGKVSEQKKTLPRDREKRTEGLRSKLSEKSRLLTEKKSQLTALAAKITQETEELETIEGKLTTLGQAKGRLAGQIPTKKEEVERAKAASETLSRTYQSKLEHTKQTIEQANKLGETFTNDDKIQELKQALQSPKAAEIFVSKLLQSRGIGSVVQKIYEKLSLAEQEALSKAILLHLYGEEPKLSNVRGAVAGLSAAGVTNESDKKKAIAEAAQRTAKRAVDTLVSMSTNDSGEVMEDYSFLTTFAGMCASNIDMINLEGASNIVTAIQKHAMEKG
ncbi:MAG: hypothetical protein LBS22_04060 [Puniceicoccales bacterium]|jgi:chromosome segregation ATPase|nr:hypothetical protein [Puniceicoccales bacterium]